MVQGDWYWGAVPLGIEVFCIAYHGGDNLLLQMSAEMLHGTQGEANLSSKAGTEWGRRHLGFCPGSDPSSAEKRADPGDPQLPLVFSRTQMLRKHCVGSGTRQKEADDLRAAFPE